MITIARFTLVEFVSSANSLPTYKVWSPGAYENPGLTSHKIAGVTVTAASEPQDVAVMKVGFLRDVAMQNSETWAVGEILWAKSGGSITHTRPTAPLPLVMVGYVFDVTAGVCMIAVNVVLLPAVTELSGVLVDAPADKDILIYNATNHYYETRQGTEADLSLSDITTNNVSTAKHGLVPKAPNDSAQFLDGTGAWSQPNLRRLHYALRGF